MAGYCESEYEAAILDLLMSLGWKRSRGDELHRKYSDALILDDLRAFLQQQYPDFTPDELERIVFNLSNMGGDTDYLSLRATASLCVNGFAFTRDDPSFPSQPVNYIDFENPRANIFRAVHQLTVRELGTERRPDILLFVNGIPLCIIELKNPAQQRASIFDAWEQIHIRYKRDIPSLMKFCLLSVLSDGGATKLGTTYAPFEHYYAWKKVENEEDAAAGLGEMQTLVEGAFKPERFLEIVRDFVYFPDVQEGQQRETEIVTHYESYAAEHAGTVSKAMIVSSTRPIAYRLHEKLKVLRPEWFEPKRVADESAFDTPEKKAELESYQRLPMVNMVATRGSNDPKDMFELLGDKAHRQMLDREFKKPRSNFRIAIVVDMWITGFDVPCLAVLYNDKPLQRHTLIQTISRVNRKYPGKEYGLIVDYIGIRKNMQQALKKYGDDDDLPPDIELTYVAFANELQILKEMLHEFDASDFFTGAPLPRLLALQRAAEFVLSQLPLPDDPQTSFSTVFKGHVRRLKSAYGILHPAGRLSKDETTWAQFLMAVQEINSKTTNTRHSVETMNRAVENMVTEALQCTGIETVLNAEGEEELFSEKFTEEIEKVKLPYTKFQLLVKSLKKAIREYSKTNQLKAQRFDERLQKVIDDYNTRDKLIFANEVASKTVQAIQNVVNQKLNKLTDEVLDLFRRLRKDREEFKRLGITFEEKAFYDILVDQRDAHGFEYSDEKCLELSRKIKALIDDSAVYADWLNNDNLKADLQSELTILLYRGGYPPEWDEEVFNKVMEQVRNFKTYNS